jgi:8-oxo-dGTP pyrophosphatase MutT (NUDIX family)
MLKDWCPGHFDLVTGGVVGAGEDDDESAQRELLEELGISLDIK